MKGGGDEEHEGTYEIGNQLSCAPTSGEILGIDFVVDGTTRRVFVGEVATNAELFGEIRTFVLRL
jgi:hypothetical protein